MTHSLLKLAVLSALAFIPTSQAFAADTLSKSAVEGIIADYVKSNPEIIIEALENYRIKQEQEQKQGMQASIDKHWDFLAGADLPDFGSDDADVTVVEFFDYNCGYCRRAVPDIQEMVKKDDKVRFVFKEMPILSANSRDIARWSLAAHEQGKYFEFHAALMEHRGSRNADVMKGMAKDLGMDADKLEKDANSDAIKAALEKSVKIAREIGVQGTPAFIVNGEIYPGYLGPEGLARAIESARQKL